MPDRHTLHQITLYVVGASLALSAIMFAVGGIDAGFGALVGAGVAVANWLAMRWVGERLLVATDAGRAVWGTLLALKMGLLLALVWLVLSTGWVDPTGFTVGLSGLVLGALLGSFHTAAAQKSENGSTPEAGSEEQA